jgi:hypothetical protein
MKNPLIGLSILPALPIVLFSVGFIISGKGPGGELWFLLCAATVLGLCGLCGLVMASLEKTYTQPGAILKSTFLILCGHIAVAIAVYGIFLSHNQQPPGTSGRPANELFPAIQLTIILLLLAWPFIAGIVAILSYSRGNA